MTAENDIIRILKKLWILIKAMMKPDNPADIERHGADEAESSDKLYSYPADGKPAGFGYMCISGF